MVEGGRALEADLLLRREHELDAGVRRSLPENPAHRLEHHDDRGLVVGAEDRPPRVPDDAVLDDRLEASVERDRVGVRAEEDRVAVPVLARDAAVDAPCRALEHGCGVVLVPLEAEIGQVLADAVRHRPLLPGRARHRAELEKQVEHGRGQLGLLHATNPTSATR